MLIALLLIHITCSVIDCYILHPYCLVSTKNNCYILNPDLKVLSQAVPLSIIAKAIISWWHHDMGMLSLFYIGGILWTKSTCHLWISLKKKEKRQSFNVFLFVVVLDDVGVISYTHVWWCQTLSGLWSLAFYGFYLRKLTLNVRGPS